MAHVLLLERLDAYLLAVTQAALMAGVDGPGVGDGQRLLDEHLAAPPAPVEAQEVAEWKIAVGLRKAV